MKKYEDITLRLPAKLHKRLEPLLIQAVSLEPKLWEIFWDDVITAMENRLKVLGKHAKHAKHAECC